MEMNISRHRNKQLSPGKHHQLIQEEQFQLLPVEQRILSESHEVDLTAASWLYWGKEDLQQERRKFSFIKYSSNQLTC